MRFFSNEKSDLVPLIQFFERYQIQFEPLGSDNKQFGQTNISQYEHIITHIYLFIYLILYIILFLIFKKYYIFNIKLIN